MTLSRQQHAEIEQARALEQKIDRSLDLIRRAGWESVAHLYAFHDAEGWRLLGYESFEEWLASPGRELKRTHVFRLLRIWRTLVVEQKVPPAELGSAEPTKVDVVLPAIKKGTVSVSDALAHVESWSRSDVLKVYGKGRDPNAPVDAKAEPEYVTCPTCSSRVERTRLEEAA